MRKELSVCGLTDSSYRATLRPSDGFIELSRWSIAAARIGCFPDANACGVGACNDR